MWELDFALLGAPVTPPAHPVCAEAAAAKRDLVEREDERERKRLRALIDVACGFDSAAPALPALFPTAPPPRAGSPAFDAGDPFKNAGIMRDIGGVKGFLRMQRAISRPSDPLVSRPDS